MTEQYAAWVLIEGPAPDDAHFLGRWLLAADEADKLLQMQFEEDPALELTIASVELASVFAFSPTATKCIEFLLRHVTSVSLPLPIWGEMFALMADIGFFLQTGDRYQMTVPKSLTREKAKAALLRLVATWMKTNCCCIQNLWFAA